MAVSDHNVVMMDLRFFLRRNYVPVLLLSPVATFSLGIRLSISTLGGVEVPGIELRLATDVEGLHVFGKIGKDYITILWNAAHNRKQYNQTFELENENSGASEILLFEKL